MNLWLENVPMMLLSVGLILGMYVQQQTEKLGETHASRTDNSPIFRWLLHNEWCEIRLDTKTIGPLDVLTGVMAPPPPSVQSVVDLTGGQPQVPAGELAEATTPTVPTRTSARINQSPGPTPQSAPKELTQGQMDAVIESVWRGVRFRIDNKIETRVKARLDERLAPLTLKLTKAGECNKKLAQDLLTSNKRLKELEKDIVALRKVRVYGNTTSPSNNGKFPAELLPNLTGAGLCIVYNLSHRLT